MTYYVFGRRILGLTHQDRSVIMIQWRELILAFVVAIFFLVLWGLYGVDTWEIQISFVLYTIVGRIWCRQWSSVFTVMALADTEGNKKELFWKALIRVFAVMPVFAIGAPLTERLRMYDVKVAVAVHFIGDAIHLMFLKYYMGSEVTKSKRDTVKTLDILPSFYTICIIIIIGWSTGALYFQQMTGKNNDVFVVFVVFVLETVKTWAWQYDNAYAPKNFGGLNLNNTEWTRCSIFANHLLMGLTSAPVHIISIPLMERNGMSSWSSGLSFFGVRTLVSWTHIWTHLGSSGNKTVSKLLPSYTHLVGLVSIYMLLSLTCIFTWFIYPDRFEMVGIFVVFIYVVIKTQVEGLNDRFRLPSLQQIRSDDKSQVFWCLSLFTILKAFDEVFLFSLQLYLSINSAWYSILFYLVIELSYVFGVAKVTLFYNSPPKQELDCYDTV